MLLRLIRDIYKIGIEILASYESKWSVNGNMMNLGGNEVCHWER